MVLAMTWLMMNLVLRQPLPLKGRQLHLRFELGCLPSMRIFEYDMSFEIREGLPMNPGGLRDQ